MVVVNETVWSSCVRVRVCVAPPTYTLGNQVEELDDGSALVVGRRVTVALAARAASVADFVTAPAESVAEFQSVVTGRLSDSSSIAMWIGIWAAASVAALVVAIIGPFVGLGLCGVGRVCASLGMHRLSVCLDSI